MIGSGFAKPASTTELPASLRDRIRPGDLVAPIAYSGHEDLTLCALNLSGDRLDTTFRRKWQAHMSQLPFPCEHVAADPAGPRTAAPGPDRCRTARQ